MTTHLDLSDAQLLAQLENCSLEPALFNHEAHLRLAWIHLKHHDIDDAIAKVCKQLERYVDSLGARDKYNTTLTVAATRTVYHFMLKSNSHTFPEFMLEFPRLKSNFKDLLFTHYGFNIFSSERAKAEYLEPDLVPFD